MFDKIKDLLDVISLPKKLRELEKNRIICIEMTERGTSVGRFIVLREEDFFKVCDLAECKLMEHPC